MLFICINIAAKELRGPDTGEASRFVVEGREETQSCTNNETFGLERRFVVFFEEGLEVMMIAGPGGSRVDCENGCEGR